jgi:hypothetical protein
MLGVIVDYEGNPLAGMGILILEDPDTQQLRSVPVENAPFFRAVNDACNAGHDLKRPGALIDYDVDDLGILAGFTVL